ncbi:MAG: hypothetical protein CLLPBCKN_008064 [Chroococcidiopsis cubana SAG 39.79]|nr:hypothetical protein [Chroococcidiopsis cubana SAG 39.79]
MRPTDRVLHLNENYHWLNVLIFPAECFIQRLYVLVLQIPHILDVSDRLVAVDTVIETLIERKNGLGMGLYTPSRLVCRLFRTRRSRLLFRPQYGH